ncbi:Predicted extracellular nuclease [Rhodoblastus acidophilus]|uniref:Predicted extracellular nuclease n=3 Tax=Rhodoblastus acidophilus TaxID=1074 RepID=A0A212PZY2_RHOAC|nr:Ig-like domain-containing protein [Rhodoblastus acidophilus]PPQ36609.1 hypothetical protein CKO16_17280 [Rhodoblastus acidophilus]SNB52524.1 Predicted extracellular nuclease [Rhodoblastus acidophilus]
MSAFTAGNIVVYRVGTGTGALSSAATAVFLDEYSPTGAWVQSIALPTADSGANQMLTASGSATSEGELNLSADGRFLVLTGYDAAPGTTGVASTSTSTVARVVGLVGANGDVNTSTALTDAASGNNIRSADSSNGVDIWVAGASGGLRYATLGATSSIQVSSTVLNLREVEIFNGQLYATDASGSLTRVGAVGTGEPTTSGQTIVALPGLPTSTGSPYEIFMADLSGSVPGMDTLYVADDGAGVLKYSLVNGSWVANGKAGASSDAYRGLTGEVNADGSVSLFATGAGGSGSTGGGKLDLLTDASGYNGAFAATAKTLATAAANEAFRGVAFAPAAAAPVDATPPTLVSAAPADDAAGVPASGDLVLTFSEAVKAGSGAIAIYRDSDNSLVQSIDVHSSAVAISGQQVTVDPPSALAGGTAYHVEIAAGAFADLAGNAYAGIADATSYNFTTAASETQTLSFATTSISQAEGDSGVTNFTFTVQRDGGTTGDASFTVKFAQGTTDAADYAGGALPSTTISGTIAAGQTSATLTIPVAGDIAPEANESFTLTLAGPPSNDVAGIAIALGASNQTAAGTLVDDDSYTHIYAIQGSGATSPLAGQTVTTRGVVTAVDTNGGESSRGFYIQDAAGDGDSRTSDAIFVYVPSGTLPTVGHMVEVTGKVSEYVSSSAYLDSPTLTEMSASKLSDLGVGPTIAPVQIGGAGGLLPPTSDMAAGAAFWESLESMEVTLKAPTAVSATDSTYCETYVAVAGPDGTTPYATGMNAHGGLTVTGGAPDFGHTDVTGGDFNPEAVQIDVDTGMFAGFAKPVVDAGAQFSDVTGIMSYAYGVEQVLATQAYSVTKASAIQKETTALTGDAGHMTLASYNLENLAPGDAARIAAHASEIFNNLGAPDVVALQEIQDNDGTTVSAVTSASATLQDLVDDLNSQAAAAGSSAHYAFIDNPFLNNNAPGTANGGAPGGNIRNAYIYRTDRVALVEGSLRTIGADGSALTAADPTQVSDPNNPFCSARPSLVATFSFNGQTVTVIDNHFSSKGGGGVLEGTDPTPLDAYEDKRAAQAQAVNTYVDSLLAANANAKIVVAGDLNEFQFEEPLKVLEGTATVSGYAYDSSPAITGTYTPGGVQVLNDLIATLPAHEQYDYNFDGDAEDLDHILVSNALANAAQFDVVHINSEFSNQTSDHDPLVTALALGGFTVPSGQTLTSAQTLGDGQNGQVQANGAFAVSATGKTNVSGVTFTGGASTLTNAGAMTAIAASGNARVVDSAATLAAGSRIAIVNTGSIVANTNDAIRINADLNGALTIDNSGTIVSGAVDASGVISGTKSGQAIDLGALTSGAATTTITNRAGGLIGAADADALRPGANAAIDNAGKILGQSGAGDSGDDGVDFQDAGYGAVTNEATGLIEGARHGVTGKLAITVHNSGTISGQLGSGVNMDTTAGTTVVVNSGTIAGHAAGSTDGDAIDVDYLLSLDNSGLIQATGTSSAGLSEAVTIGGGTIVNEAGGQIVSAQRAITVDDSNDGDAYAATTIANAGLIEGDNGEAIAIVDTFADTLINSGTIIGSVALGGGDDRIILNGGGISGTIDGGAGTDTIDLNAATGTLGALVSVEILNVAGADWTLNGDGVAAVNLSDGAHVLRLGAATLADGHFDGAIDNFGADDTLDLEGVGRAATATLVAGNVLKISGGAGDVAVTLDPNADYSEAKFSLADDGAGGALVTFFHEPTVTVAEFQARRTELDQSGHPFDIADTAANVASALDALAGDAHIASIALTDAGTPALNVTLKQAADDAAALARIATPHTLTIVDVKTHVASLTAAQIAALAAAGVSRISVTDQAVGLSLAQKAALGSSGVALMQPYSGGATQIVTFNGDGSAHEIQCFGIAGQMWDATDAIYSGGKPVSESWTKDDGLWQTKTWDPTTGQVTDLQTFTPGTILGHAYTSVDTQYVNGVRTTVDYAVTDGHTARETFTGDGGWRILVDNAPAQAKTMSADPANVGGYDILTYDATGQFDHDVIFNAAGKPLSETWANGQTETWSYDAGGAVTEAVIAGIPGQKYDATDTHYANGKAVAESWTKDGDPWQIKTWDPTTGQVTDLQTFTPGTILGHAYASVDNQYVNGVRTTADYATTDGHAAHETFASDGGWAIFVDNVLAQAKSANASGWEIQNFGLKTSGYDETDVFYGADGKPLTAVWLSHGAAVKIEDWNADGSVAEVATATAHGTSHLDLYAFDMSTVMEWTPNSAGAGGALTLTQGNERLTVAVGGGAADYTITPGAGGVGVTLVSATSEFLHR